MTKFILAIISGVYALINRIPYHDPSPPVSNTPSETIKANKINGYEYQYFIAAEADQVELYGNWSEKRSLKDKALEKKCQSAINGGFYDTDGNPLGLFINSEINKKRAKTSNLINGYIYSSEGIINIDKTLPDKNDWASQVGPILIDGIKIVNDEPARRSVAINLANSPGQIIFLTVYSENSRLDGPKLEELPKIVEAIGLRQQWNIKTAINLDGGSASAFFDGDIYIPELTFVGSFFL